MKRYKVFGHKYVFYSRDPGIYHKDIILNKRVSSSERISKEIMATKITPEAQLVLLITQEIVYAKRNNEQKCHLLSCSNINWDRVKQLMIYHEITAFAYLSLKDYCYLLPEGLLDFLSNTYYCSLLRDQYLWEEFLIILDAAKRAGVILVPIKGISLLRDLYKQYPIRHMTDIDVLIEEKEFQKAEGIFYDLGYKKELSGLQEDYWKRHQCHIAFSKKIPDRFSALVEVHWALDFKRRQRNILKHLWQRLKIANIEGKDMWLLSPEDALFSLALHNRRFGKVLCLKNVCDLGLILDKLGVAFDWDYVLREAKRGKMRTSLYFILSQAKIFLGKRIPKDVWRGLDIPGWKKGLICRFIEENTFLRCLEKKGKQLYLKSHFLLYDSLREPVEYIINIPREQFGRYYNLEPYAKRTAFLYRNRLIYMLFKAVFHRRSLIY